MPTTTEPLTTVSATDLKPGQVIVRDRDGQPEYATILCQGEQYEATYLRDEPPWLGTYPAIRFWVMDAATGAQCSRSYDASAAALVHPDPARLADDGYVPVKVFGTPVDVVWLQVNAAILQQGARLVRIEQAGL